MSTITDALTSEPEVISQQELEIKTKEIDRYPKISFVETHKEEETGSETEEDETETDPETEETDSETEDEDVTTILSPNSCIYLVCVDDRPFCYTKNIMDAELAAREYLERRFIRKNLGTRYDFCSEEDSLTLVSKHDYYIVEFDRVECVCTFLPIWQIKFV